MQISNCLFSLACRDVGQGSSEEIRNKDLKRDLEDREKSYKDKADRRERERPLRSVSSTVPTT